MLNRTNLSLLFALLSLLPATAFADRAIAPIITGGLRINLTRTPCRAKKCPGYTVSVDERGNVSYRGEVYVRVLGKRTGWVPKRVLEQLESEFDRIGFFSFPDGLEDVCQEDYGNDRSRVQVYFKSKGKQREVVDNPDCQGNVHLDALREVEKKIDELLKTEQWVR